ncbi:hypothetical protein BJY52DRAFT_1377723 [Lactarius psammicola]|nr:hypothetical protein BJY52DRAFT_1377723 [Lactarius psammicola]
MSFCSPRTWDHALVCPTPLHFSPMSSGAPDVDAHYFQYKRTVYDNLFVGIIYGEGQEARHCPSSFEPFTGVYIVFYFTSTYILLMFRFGITTFMFILGIIVLVQEAALGFQRIIWSLHRIRVVFAVHATITCLMYILSDVICARRTVLLWNRDKRVIAILLSFILGTTGLISDSHNHSCHHAEEPSRIPLDLLDRNGVRECASTLTTQRWRHPTTRYTIHYEYASYSDTQVPYAVYMMTPDKERACDLLSVTQRYIFGLQTHTIFPGDICVWVLCVQVVQPPTWKFLDENEEWTGLRSEDHIELEA